MTAKEDMKFNPEKIREGVNPPPYQRIKVVCGKCGRKESVDPMLAPKRIDKSYKMRYVCNECSSHGG